MDKMLERHTPCMLFEQLFVDRMPNHLQLADADFTDPRRVAEHADELWQALNNEGHKIHGGGEWQQKTHVKEAKNHNADWCLHHNKLGAKAKKYQDLKISGKLAGRLPVAAAVSRNSMCLLYAWDCYSGAASSWTWVQKSS